MLRISLVVMALLAFPMSAHAAAGFVGVTERGGLVRFTDEAPYGMTTPKRPRGLAPGERLVAIARPRSARPSPRGCAARASRSPRRPTATAGGCSPTSGRTSSSIS